MLPEIQALLNGAQQGKMQYAGIQPSGSQVGGAPPNNTDPAAARWDATFRALSGLADSLQQQRRELIANKVAKLAVQLQHLHLEERKKIAENAAGTTSGPSGMEAVAGMHSEGIPERA